MTELLTDIYRELTGCCDECDSCVVIIKEIVAERHGITILKEQP